MRVPETKPARPKGDAKDALTFRTVASHALKIAGRVDIASWHGRGAPERRWVVDGLLPEGNVTMLAGDGGIGKSVLALQLLGACAFGKPWIGQNARPCKMVGVFCEDDEDEPWRRLEAVARHYGASASDLAEHLHLWSRVGQDNVLMTWRDPFGPGETTALFDQISNVAVDVGAELVVLDSLHDLFGGNENSRLHARQFVGELRALAMHIRGGVLLTAHPSLTGRYTGTGEAGSTAWNNTVRSRLYLTAPTSGDGDDEPGDYRELRTKKSNYGPPGGKIRLRWDAGVFVPADGPGAGPGMVATIERRTVETVFLEALDSAAKQGRSVSASPSSPDYAPKVFLRMPEARACRRAELERAMNALFTAGKIRNDVVGKLANRMPRMGIVRVEGKRADAVE